MSDTTYNIYFELFDEIGYLGSIRRCNMDSLKTNEADLYLAAVFWIKSMLLNANKFLFANKDKLPREVYALKLLDRMDMKGSNQTYVPKRTQKTYDIIEPYRIKFDLDALEDTRFDIILDKKEADTEKFTCKQRVYIHLDTKFAVMEGFFQTVDFTDYCKLTGYDTKKVVEFYNNLPKMPAMISRPDFNNLEDVYTMVTQNYQGFKGVLDETIIIIK